MPVYGLHHVSLVVSDTARALAFYRDVLGLQVDHARPDLGFPGAWLRLGDHGLHLLELPNPDPVDGRPAHGGRDRHSLRSAPPARTWNDPAAAGSSQLRCFSQ